MSVKIIAEVGVNHNGSLACAKELVEAAANAGADIVKFQSFKAKDLALPCAPKAKYQERHTDKNESQMEMLKKLELDEAAHLELIEHCKKYEIEFLSSPFDIESINLLRDMGLKTIKVPSGELTNAPYLMKIGASGCKVLLSTGMSTLEEIELALGVLAFNYLKYAVRPSLEAFSSAFRDTVAANALEKHVTLLHCTSEYPAAYEDLNLLAMDLMREHFGLPVGYSDHTRGIHAPLVAVARGAVIIEKHFTLDKSLPGPDHAASLEPHELKEMIDSIRIVELALGSKRKSPSGAENENKKIVRKSLIAACDIRKGELFSATNLTVKRPGTGISSMRYYEAIGRSASRNYEKDEFIDELF